MKALLKLETEIAGIEALVDGVELGALPEDPLLPHAATTRAALAAIDVQTIFLATCCNETTSLFRGPDAVSFYSSTSPRGRRSDYLPYGL